MILPVSESNEYQHGGLHYRNLRPQPWEVMESWFPPDEFRGYLRGNILKYLARYPDKGNVDDLKKAQHYLAKLIAFELTQPNRGLTQTNATSY